MNNLDEVGQQLDHNHALSRNNPTHGYWTNGDFTLFTPQSYWLDIKMVKTQVAGVSHEDHKLIYLNKSF